MLLRWLLNNYFRENAEGKVRAMAGDLLRNARSNQETTCDVMIPTSQHAAAESRGPNSEGEFLPCDVAFIYALGIESGGLVDRMQGAEASKHSHGIERAGKIGRHEVVVIQAGVGQKAAARATAEAIKFYRPRWVVSAGFAGGLDETLRRGHIVMADEVVNLSGGRLSVGLKLDPESFTGMKGLHVGRLLTVDTILRQPAERRRLAQKHEAIACDMESFAVAEACRQHDVPLLAIRIISDAVDDELPPEIENLLAQKSLAGKLGAATGAVLKRFSAAKDLWKLREEGLKASDRLAKFLVGIVEQLPNDK
jgi:adenosylhomocysteine nucleosidase